MPMSSRNGKPRARKLIRVEDNEIDTLPHQPTYTQNTKMTVKVYHYTENVCVWIATNFELRSDFHIPACAHMMIIRKHTVPLAKDPA